MRFIDCLSDVCSSDLLQGALELMGLPYTGSGPLASCLAMDKIMTKKICVQQGLPTPEFAILATRADLAGAIARLGLPLIVKPPHEIGRASCGERVCPSV